MVKLIILLFIILLLSPPIQFSYFDVRPRASNNLRLNKRLKPNIQDYFQVVLSGLVLSSMFPKFSPKFLEKREWDPVVLSQSLQMGRCPPVPSCLVSTKTRLGMQMLNPTYFWKLKIWTRPVFRIHSLCKCSTFYSSWLSI